MQRAESPRSCLYAVGRDAPHALVTRCCGCTMVKAADEHTLAIGVNVNRGENV